MTTVAHHRFAWAAAHRIMIVAVAVALAVAAALALVVLLDASPTTARSTATVQQDEPLSTHDMCALARVSGC
jgi:hypothetical protein